MRDDRAIQLYQTRDRRRMMGIAIGPQLPRKNRLFQ
jgi:hypothetical protein